jgi:2-oxoglutarate ferredoxin oxidoreductase subunit gamma
MEEKIIIAGSGGQGIMFLGKILAQAALIENRYLTWLPAYGAEVRGGAAYCMVSISEEEIASPFIEKADTLIIMNEPSWLKFRNKIKDNGLVLMNKSLVSSKILTRINADICARPFTEIAAKLGNIKVANMVALGAYLAKKKSIKLNSVLKAIREIILEENKDFISVNKNAVLAGARLIGRRYNNR